MIKTVLNIEDTILKHTAISRALKKNGVQTVDLAKTAEEGLDMVAQKIKEGNPYDLIITDMHFPVNGKDEEEAGLYVIHELEKRGSKIPIIVCSSVRYRIPEIADCIFYNERSGDLDSDIREMLGRL